MNKLEALTSTLLGAAAGAALATLLTLAIAPESRGSWPVTTVIMVAALIFKATMIIRWWNRRNL